MLRRRRRLRGRACRYPVRAGAACDDGDACTADDVCDEAGACAGEPLRCDAPPGPVCLGGGALSEPRAPGICEGGACNYPSIERACPDGCVDGACRCVASPWETGIVDDAADVGRYTDLAVDAAGALHVAYYEAGATGSLRYARRAAGGGWTWRIVDDEGDVGGSPSIGVAADGTVHVIYDNLGRRSLKHAYREPGRAWAREGVPGPGDRWNGALAIGADGALHVAFTDGSDPDGTQLGVAHRSPEGEWTVERVDGSAGDGLFASIGIDPAGTLHVAHLDGTQGALRYARRATDAGWTTSVVDDGGEVGGGTALAINRLGAVHVAYFHPADQRLHHAERAPGGAWAITPILAAPPSRWTATIAIDGYDVVHIVHDLVSADLQHTYRAADGVWRSERVGTTGYSVSYLGGTAIEIDRRGDLHVTHHDERHRTLRHAWRRFCP